MSGRALLALAALVLVACTATDPDPATLRTGFAAQLAETPTASPSATQTSTATLTATSTRTRTRTPTALPTATPTSRWYDATYAARMAANVASCPSLPLGCFGQPPDCIVDLCYCPKRCEPALWDHGPGLTGDGVWAGRGISCVCKGQ